MRILDRSEVIQLTGLSKGTIRRLESEGRFPNRRQLSPQRIGWLESDVQQWLSELPTAKEQPIEEEESRNA
ncbi:MAG: AlpA family phage regulatory protein [Bdellovibrionales bacterium]|nr:AlpA family phage regulatory protein [Bdellovibrionales bacterium]